MKTKKTFFTTLNSFESNFIKLSIFNFIKVIIFWISIKSKISETETLTKTLYGMISVKNHLIFFSILINLAYL